MRLQFPERLAMVPLVVLTVGFWIVWTAPPAIGTMAAAIPFYINLLLYVQLPIWLLIRVLWLLITGRGWEKPHW